MAWAQEQVIESRGQSLSVQLPGPKPRMINSRPALQKGLLSSCSERLSELWNFQGIYCWRSLRSLNWTWFNCNFSKIYCIYSHSRCPMNKMHILLWDGRMKQKRYLQSLTWRGTGTRRGWICQLHWAGAECLHQDQSLQPSLLQSTATRLPSSQPLLISFSKS